MSEKLFKPKYHSITYKAIDYDGNQYTVDDLCGLLNELSEENKYLKKRIKVISDELYCKDRKLEELGVPIECCDKR